MRVIVRPEHEAASEMLAWAIEIFLSGRGYYAALHHAGAAEEVLAAYMKAPDIDLVPASESFKSLVLHLQQPGSASDWDASSKWIYNRMHDARNSVKHKRGHADHVLVKNARSQAAEVINRAISKYVQLLGKIALRAISGMAQFDALRYSKQP